MLRGQTNPKPVADGVSVPPPVPDSEPVGLDQPYRTAERPAGIVFVRGPSSFWLPYHLLQGMRYEPDKLTLEFPTADVVIEGRGLHGLFTEFTRQVVGQVIEQGARYAELSDAPTCIRRVVELPKGKDQAPSDEDTRK
jgi:hypothetical protein